MNIVTRPYDNMPSPVDIQTLLMGGSESLYDTFIAQGSRNVFRKFSSAE